MLRGVFLSYQKLRYWYYHTQIASPLLTLISETGSPMILQGLKADS